MGLWGSVKFWYVFQRHLIGHFVKQDDGLGSPLVWSNDAALIFLWYWAEPWVKNSDYSSPEVQVDWWLLGTMEEETMVWSDLQTLLCRKYGLAYYLNWETTLAVIVLPLEATGPRNKNAEQIAHESTEQWHGSWSYCLGCRIQLAQIMYFSWIFMNVHEFKWSSLCVHFSDKDKSPLSICSKLLCMWVQASVLLTPFWMQKMQCKVKKKNTHNQGCKYNDP